ncbi:MAG: hypothetical protein WCI31_00030 [Prolixibacteraceae bacterium]
MKRAVSILFAALILVSGIHLTIASHICCGELAAVKCSITGEKATCGMEDNSAPCPANGVIEVDCCKNRIAACSTDHNYFPSFQEIENVQSLALAHFVAISSGNPSEIYSPKTYHSMVGPPVFDGYNSVKQSFICVFII